MAKNVLRDLVASAQSADGDAGAKGLREELEKRTSWTACGVCGSRMDPETMSATSCCGQTMCSEICKPFFKAAGHCPSVKCLTYGMDSANEHANTDVDKCQNCELPLEFGVSCRTCRTLYCLSCYRSASRANPPVCPVCSMDDLSDMPPLPSDYVTLHDQDCDCEMAMGVKTFIRNGWEIICPIDQARLKVDQSSTAKDLKFSCTSCPQKYCLQDFTEIRDANLFLRKTRPFFSTDACLEPSTGGKLQVKPGTDMKRLARSIAKMALVMCPCCRQKLTFSENPKEPTAYDFKCPKCQRRFRQDEVISQYVEQTSLDLDIDSKLAAMAITNFPFMLTCGHCNETAESDEPPEATLEGIEGANGYEFTCSKCAKVFQQAGIVDRLFACNKPRSDVPPIVVFCTICSDGFNNNVAMTLNEGREMNCDKCKKEKVSLTEVKRQIMENLAANLADPAEGKIELPCPKSQFLPEDKIEPVKNGKTDKKED